MRYVLALAAAALVAAAPAPQCPRPGEKPALNGDPFVPVDCATAPAKALPLPAETAGDPAKPDLKPLFGSWEGVLVRGIGRYAATFTAAPGKRGRVELTLRWKEQQFRQTGETRLVLTPGKGAGVYAATLTSSLLPEAKLEGKALFSARARPDGAPLPVVELSFPNGAAPRLSWELPAPDALKFSAAWGVPNAPLQLTESEMRRAAKP